MPKESIESYISNLLSIKDEYHNFNDSGTFQFILHWNNHVKLSANGSTDWLMAFETAIEE